MRSPCLVRLLVLPLLAGAPLARAQPQPAACQPEGRSIELPANAAAPPAELCIGPELSTTLMFDMPLAEGGVTLEGREHFRRVEAGGTTLTLLPSKELPTHARLRLEVRFARAAPAPSARFVLVARPAQAERLVEVVGAAPDSRFAEVQRLRAELQECRAQLAQLSKPQSGPSLFATMQMEGMFDEGGYSSLTLRKKDLTPAPGERVQVERLTLSRSRSRLTVKVRVENQDRGGQPWAPRGASLTGAPGAMAQALWLQEIEPIAPGAAGTVWLEFTAPGAGAQRSFTLQLWDEGRTRTATVHGVKLP